jgi:CrcB protein
MSRFFAVACGGALGSMARYGVALFVALFWRRDFPLATLAINVSGCFILGFFSTFAAERSALDPVWRLFVATGFVGAYTTFSTFEYETQRLTEAGALWWGALNVISSVVAGYAAVRLGIVLARR